MSEQQLFVTGFNCDPAHACEVMLRTETIWGKGGENHVLGYHVIQSFAPGEVTPKQAHEIGCEFARRAFAERYEATVSTHLNTGTLHNHIVFNSVSFVDGKMFRNDFKGYFKPTSCSRQSPVRWNSEHKTTMPGAVLRRANIFEERTP